MDRADAVAAQLRVAHDAVLALQASRVPEVDAWIGPASAAAGVALDDLERSLHGLRAAASEWLTAARRAAHDG